MLRLTSLFAIVALAGCPMQKSGGSAMAGGPSGGGGGNPNVSSDAMITMPDLTGKTRDEAIALVSSAGFKHEAETQPLSCDGPAQEVGRVDCQDPEPGKSVKAYTLVRFNVKEGSHLGHLFLRKDFESLAGLTVEQAKAKAKQIGHTGELRVEKLDEFVTGCKENTVCTATDQLGGQAGMSKEDPLLLRTQKTLSIAPPPD